MVKVLDENELLPIFQSSFNRRKGLSPPGDDCAVLAPPPGRRLVQTCDQLVEGVHVPTGCHPEQMAVKLVRRSLSDLAAAGAEPWAASWTILAPCERGADWVEALARAFLKESSNFDMSVVGGDVSNGPSVVLTCTLLGLEGHRTVPGRGGATPGDGIWVTGFLGGAVRSGRHLKPEPRLVEGRVLNEEHQVRAMMDISDGLAADLPRLLEASGVGAEISLDSLPLGPSLKPEQEGWEQAVGDGEDYELLAVVGSEQELLVKTNPRLEETGIVRIGRIRKEKGLKWLVGGNEVLLKSTGWQSDWA